MSKKKDELKIERLRKIIEDTFWMAIRYAHGRHTFAPTIIRDSLKELKEVFPDFSLRDDSTIQPPTEDELKQHFAVREDWLDDLFSKARTEEKINKQGEKKQKVCYLINQIVQIDSILETVMGKIDSLGTNVITNTIKDLILDIGDILNDFVEVKR